MLKDMGSSIYLPWSVIEDFHEIISLSEKSEGSTSFTSTGFFWIGFSFKALLIWAFWVNNLHGPKTQKLISRRVSGWTRDLLALNGNLCILKLISLT